MRQLRVGCALEDNAAADALGSLITKIRAIIRPEMIGRSSLT